MRAAKIENSKRLQRVYSALKSRKNGMTTMQIIERAGVCAVNSIISELRCNGVAIKCRREGNAWRYTLDS